MNKIVITALISVLATSSTFVFIIYIRHKQSIEYILKNIQKMVPTKKNIYGQTPLMQIIMKSKYDVPTTCYYDNCQQDTDRYGNFPALLWVKYRNIHVPEQLTFDGWQFQYNRKGECPMEYIVQHQLEKYKHLGITGLEGALRGSGW